MCSECICADEGECAVVECTVNECASAQIHLLHSCTALKHMLAHLLHTHQLHTTHLYTCALIHFFFFHSSTCAIIPYILVHCTVIRFNTCTLINKTCPLVHFSTCTLNCNTLQHTATHTSARCNTLQHSATHCNTLQHTATHL